MTSAPDGAGEDKSQAEASEAFGPPRDGIFISDGSECRTVVVSPTLPPAMARDTTWRVEDLELHKELYRGKTSMLYHATDKQSGMQVALKLYRKRKLSVLNRYQVEREIRIHINLDHEYIIKLFVAFEDEKHVYLVQEFANSGDLFEDLKKTGGQFKERQAVKEVLQPFLKALNYLHGKGIIHRDIKPENILLTSNRVIKVADFGLSIDINYERPVTRAGTLDYMAPEVLICPDKRRPEENKDKALLAYNAQVDSWAVGILAYELLVGYPPFEQESRAATYEYIMYREPKFPPFMTDEAKAFVSLALCKNASKRPGVADLVGHAWVLQHCTKDVKDASHGSHSPLKQRSTHAPKISDDVCAPTPPSYRNAERAGSGKRAELATVRPAPVVVPSTSLCNSPIHSPKKPLLSSPSKASNQHQRMASKASNHSDVIVLQDLQRQPSWNLAESMSDPILRTMQSIEAMDAVIADPSAFSRQESSLTAHSSAASHMSGSSTSSQKVNSLKPVSGKVQPPALSLEHTDNSDVGDPICTSFSGSLDSESSTTVQGKVPKCFDPALGIRSMSRGPSALTRYRPSPVGTSQINAAAPNKSGLHGAQLVVRTHAPSGCSSPLDSPSSATGYIKPPSGVLSEDAVLLSRTSSHTLASGLSAVQAAALSGPNRTSSFRNSPVGSRRTSTVDRDAHTPPDQEPPPTPPVPPNGSKYARLFSKMVGGRDKSNQRSQSVGRGYVRQNSDELRNNQTRDGADSAQRGRHVRNGPEDGSSYHGRPHHRPNQGSPRVAFGSPKLEREDSSSSASVREGNTPTPTVKAVREKEREKRDHLFSSGLRSGSFTAINNAAYVKKLSQGAVVQKVQEYVTAHAHGHAPKNSWQHVPHDVH